MPVQFVGTQAEIADAIDRFPSSYHRDYSVVRARAQAYLAAPLSEASASPLGQELRDVLLRWGAGQRKAPALQPVQRIGETLLDSVSYELLVGLAAAPLPKLGLSAHGSRTVGGFSNPIAAETFDRNLLEALARLSRGLFIDNTNVTYPMKAILLITGMMPAFDSQVRKGLGRGGFQGVDKTQFLLPNNVLSPDGKKVTRLPFLLGDCWNRHADLIISAVRTSKSPSLVDEPGRVFDVILFMQARTHQPVLSYQPPRLDWYELA